MGCPAGSFQPGHLFQNASMLPLSLGPFILFSPQRSWRIGENTCQGYGVEGYVRRRRPGRGVLVGSRDGRWDGSTTKVMSAGAAVPSIFPAV